MKKKKKKEKAGKIIECIAIGLRHLSVRRPKTLKYVTPSRGSPTPHSNLGDIFSNYK